MQTAIDSNVLLDVFLSDPRQRDRSLGALEEATGSGRLVVCELVAAEVGGRFRHAGDARAVFEAVGLIVEPVRFETACLAGRLWREYRQTSGRRDRIVADFVIGAHALEQADALLTRDPGFYQSYFPRLRLIEP